MAGARRRVLDRGRVGGGGVRLGLWGAALAVEYVSPAVGFWTPGLGRSTTDDWDVEGGHLAERCSLFIIIALGESLLVTGATFEGLPWTAPTVAAFAVAFVGSVVMWWIYFDTGAERGVRRITTSDDPGRLARLIYTYVHLLVVGGVIVASVADELVLAHPAGRTEVTTAAAVLGGPALFLLGNLLFKRAIAGLALAGLGLLAGLVPAAAVASPLLLGAAVAAALAMVALWETVSLRSRRPAILEP